MYIQRQGRKSVSSPVHLSYLLPFEPPPVQVWRTSSVGNTFIFANNGNSVPHKVLNKPEDASDLTCPMC